MNINIVDQIMSHKALLTPEECAAFLNVDVETCRRWIRNGRIKGIKLTKAFNAPVRVEPSELALFVNSLLTRE